jgi:hypothetical protein
MAVGNKPGTIYNDGIMLHIMDSGSVTFVTLFILRFEKHRFDKINIILLCGIIIAGNFAFQLGLVLYAVYYICKHYIIKNKKWCYNIVLIMFLGMLFLILSLPYVNYKRELKADTGNALRDEQAEILLTTGNIITGNGFGYDVKVKGKKRDYTGSIYYELQSFYILNQIGLVGFVYFMFITIYLLYEKNRKMLPIYIVYLVYTFFNPYVFDTGQMIVLMLMVSYNAERKKHGHMSYYSLNQVGYNK